MTTTSPDLALTSPPKSEVLAIYYNNVIVIILQYTIQQYSYLPARNTTIMTQISQYYCCAHTWRLMNLLSSIADAVNQAVLSDSSDILIRNSVELHLQ
jgi:hypothetical protein